MKSFQHLAFFLLLLAPFYSSAGWLITGRYIDREGNTILKRYFIQNNEVKVERYNLIYTCNLKTGSIILVDPEKLVYTKTSIDAYRNKMREIKMSRLNELLNLMTEAERAEYEKNYRKQVEDELFLPPYADDSLVMTKVSDTVKLLGHRTERLRVEEFGKLKEELFYSKDINMSADIDLGLFLQYVYLIEPEDKTVKYRASKKYMDKVKNGLVIRRFLNEDGYRTEWQVNNYEQKNIPAYEFATPAMCKLISLDKWLSRGEQTSEKYYDDYE
jgi:hypothetical protein